MAVHAAVVECAIYRQPVLRLGCIFLFRVLPAGFETFIVIVSAILTVKKTNARSTKPDVAGTNSQDAVQQNRYRRSAMLDQLCRVQLVVGDKPGNENVDAIGE